MLTIPIWMIIDLFRSMFNRLLRAFSRLEQLDFTQTTRISKHTSEEPTLLVEAVISREPLPLLIENSLQHREPRKIRVCFEEGRNSVQN